MQLINTTFHTKITLSSKFIQKISEAEMTAEEIEEKKYASTTDRTPPFSGISTY